jgi:hypothetical protein
MPRSSGTCLGAYEILGRFVRCVLILVTILSLHGSAGAGEGSRNDRAKSPSPDSTRWSSFLPLMKEEAEKHGIELPLPFGVGLVYYHLERDIEITQVRVGRNGAQPVSVSDYAQLAARADVDNVNVKLDAWILPFLNVYAIVGYAWNESETKMDVELPPLIPGGPPRQGQVTLPTTLEGSIGGVGITLAAGFRSFFLTYDGNIAQADLGLDDRFKVVVSSVRTGWHGKVGTKPLRLWASLTDWNTFATMVGTIDDPDGGTLTFEADQGPAYRYTYGLGAHTAPSRHIEFAVDGGIDGHSGWYVAVVPIFRF